MPRIAKEKPHLSSGEANRQLDKIESHIDQQQEQLSKLTVDEMAKAPLSLDEPQTKITKKQIEKYDAPVIRACKSFVMPIPKTNYDKSKFERLIAEDEELIKVICENHEVIGESIELWAGNYPGQILGFYKVPVNIPVWVPRKVAKRIRQCKYHRIKMSDRSLNELQSEMSANPNGASMPSGVISVTETKRRLDCRLASNDF